MPHPVQAGELVGGSFISRSRARVETVLTTSGNTWLGNSFPFFCDAVPG